MQRGYGAPRHSLYRHESSPKCLEAAGGLPPANVSLGADRTALQARLEEARANWDATLASKDRALQQLEASLAAERQSCQQHQAAAGESLPLPMLTTAQTADTGLSYPEAEPPSLQQVVSSLGDARPLGEQPCRVREAELPAASGRRQ